MSETISGGLTLVIPSIGDQNWGESFRDDFATPISEHQHTGGGDGLQLVTSSIADNAITGAKFRLTNNVGVRSRNAANSADVEIVKLNASDQVEFGSASVTGLRLANNSFLVGRNAADSANIDLIKVDASNNVTFGANANTATTRAALGLAIGTNVQAWDTDLDTIAGLSKTDGNFIVANGSAWVAESGATARTSLSAAESGANSDITSLSAAATVASATAMTIGTTSSGAVTIKTAGTDRVVVTTNQLRGITDNFIDLGSSAVSYKDLYFKGSLIWGGTAKQYTWNAHSSTTRTSLDPAVATAGQCAEAINTLGKYLVEFGLFSL